MILSKPQSIIASDTHRFRVINCGRRFGKTTLAVLEMISKALPIGGVNICYIAPTYQQARDIAWQQLKEMVQPIYTNINESRLEVGIRTQDGGKSQIWLRGWESIETLRGQKFDLIIIDEVASMKNFKASWEEVVRPTLTDVAGHAMFISTPKGFNHFYELFNREQEDKDYKSFHFTSYDNPYIPKEELDKAKEEMTEDRFAQEYMADFRKTSGLVYKEFDRKRHIFDNDTVHPQIVETMLGIDFGYTNPAAILEIKKDSDNHYWVYSEWYKTKQSNSQIAEKALSFSPNFVYADPEAPEKIQELMSKGLNLRDVNKGKDSVQNGINRVRELFKQNRLHIHERCKNTILELETYHYEDDEGLDGNSKENPIKDNDHAMDALRYVLMTNEPYIAIDGEDYNLFKESYG